MFPFNFNPWSQSYGPQTNSNQQFNPAQFFNPFASNNGGNNFFNGFPFFNNNGNRFETNSPQRHPSQSVNFNRSSQNNSPFKNERKNTNDIPQSFPQKEKQAPYDQLKNLGNEYFRNGNYIKAIELYSKAIENNPSQPTSYLNRAIAYKNLNNLKNALSDCSISIELDDKNYKSYLLLGRIYAELSKTESNLNKIEKALQKIEKAIKCYYENEKKQPDDQIIKEIRRFYFRAKKVYYYKQKEINKGNVFELFKLCPNETSKKELELIIDNPFKSDQNDYIIPDELCCKITLDLMEDPYLCPSGISYEKKVLFEHLQKNNFDPVTREKLEIKQIFPNISLKIIIDKFIENNPWAFEYGIDENYMTIKF